MIAPLFRQGLVHRDRVMCRKPTGLIVPCAPTVSRSQGNARSWQVVGGFFWSPLVSDSWMTSLGAPLSPMDYLL